MDKNRVLNIAVGTTVVIVLLRWILTGELAFLASTAVRGEEVGSATDVVIPLLTDALAFIGASVIAWMTGLWNLVASLLFKSEKKSTEEIAPMIEAANKVIDMLLFGKLEEAQEFAKEHFSRPEILAEELRQAVRIGDIERAKQIARVFIGNQG